MRGFPGLMLLSSCLALPLSASAAGGVDGLWLDQDKSGYIEIAKEGEFWQGRIAGSVEGEVLKDVKNPDPAERGRSLLGQRLLKDLVDGGDGQLRGFLYNPRDGKTYSVHISLNEDDTLRVHGYIGISLFGLTQKWTRVTDRNIHGLQSKPLPDRTAADAGKQM